MHDEMTSFICTVITYLNMTNELRIYTQINSRFPVFDISGHLQFSIVFGLCRRSSADTDLRPLLLETAGSILDVPYALAHGLLTLHEHGSQGIIDVSRLKNVAVKGVECLSLPSPVNRTERWRDAITVYQCCFNVNDELTSLLKPGRKYTIRLASEDLGVKRWAYSDRKQFVDIDEEPRIDSEAAKLINSRSTAGSATFAVVKCLSWPPKIKTRMRLCTISPSSDYTTALEVSVINTSSEPVTVQTRGHQLILTPWGPFQPEPDADDSRTRIIDATSHKPPISSLQVFDIMTGKMVRGNQQRSTCTLTDSNVDRRLKMEDLVTLKPGTPLVRKLDIAARVKGLADGRYKIRMQSKGCGWWHGEVEKEIVNGELTPVHFCTPLMLESQDEMELCIRDGEVNYTM